ncbi:hypothetical protein [Arenicella xantha]|uniref:Uncharacterized protein n=1 Tax=Arenicella xantha TaxID=644221 RepID=A0A395JER7_9GAMM|nr:hypothetical protein [Arenicella xantha]RBP47140.1 hypothetical protein DFR28_10912 [Arenicella xantha]
MPFAFRAKQPAVVAYSSSDNRLYLPDRDQNRVLDPVEVTRIMRSSGRVKVYLLVPADNVISIAVPLNKRGMSVDAVVAELMPFKAEELWYVAADAGARVDAVLRQELVEPLDACKEALLSISGLAFDAAQQRRFVEFHDFAGDAGQARAVPRNRYQRRLVLGAVTLIALFGLSGYWWSQESKLQTSLQQKISALNQSNSGLEFDSDVIMTSGQGSSVATTVNYLESLSRTLPNDAVVDQAILNAHTLVLDMRARSSSLVRTRVDTNDLVIDSEFVSAISADGARDVERFRLKLKFAATDTTQEGADD